MQVAYKYFFTTSSIRIENDKGINKHVERYSRVHIMLCTLAVSAKLNSSILPVFQDIVYERKAKPVRAQLLKGHQR